MAPDPPDDEPAATTGPAGPLQDGPFVLRPLLDDVPLSEDGQNADIKITCVDYLDRGLYVGTSASELLHFVQIPADTGDESGIPTFILAARLRPAYSEPSGIASGSRPGVQQILLLPRVGKACILCNWTVTFYSLPELSPVFGTMQVRNCHWIGGMDLNELNADQDTKEPAAGVSILISRSRRIQVVMIGEDARHVKNIDFAGSTISVRRESIACVADSRSYALLEIERQLKIPLTSISSLDEGSPGGIVGEPQDISQGVGGGVVRSASSALNRPHAEANDPPAHKRGTSLGNFMTGTNRKQDQAPGDAEEPVFQEPVSREATPGPESLQGPSSAPQTDKAVHDAPGVSSNADPPARSKQVFLRPQIVSPAPEEFLLVTGTGPLEPGIGMFVNLDGDPTRPTIQFSRYPKEIAVYGGGVPDLSSRPSAGSEEGFILASMGRESEHGVHHGLEIQRWDTDAAEGEPPKYWLAPPVTTPCKSLGVRSLLGHDDTYFPEIIDRLRQQKFRPFSSKRDRDDDSEDEDFLPQGWEAKRTAEEEVFVRRLAGASARVAVWSGSRIWWAIRNPLLLELEAKLERVEMKPFAMAANRQELFVILKSIRGRDATSELEFLTFNYVRQRAGILFLRSFLQSEDAQFSEPELKAVEEVLVDGLLDPRVVLSLVPGVRNEVLETKKGIWIFGGVKTTAEEYISSRRLDRDSSSLDALSPEMLQFLKRFLTAWRQKKGFGSVPDENEVFRTVDAALLAVLLELDKHSPQGLAKGKSLRSELYEVVDGGVDCFDRAESIIESYHRLFVLSRLYQSRKMAGEVLATWRRIVEGERDDGGELRAGELRVREYLQKISSQALVREYGIWLARRNPKLGIQVFADDKGRAQKFDPAQVVEMLREEAPDAVKYYLEYLVFTKAHTAYVNELITYYLDIVIADLQSSSEARERILSTYSSYKALRPPKPTYRQFITDNAPAGNEPWQSRLRLLQLLGGPHDYDSAAIRNRIAGLNATAEDLLVPETIILDGHERKHENALRLLVHRLGDFDTAVSYCLRGDASIYSGRSIYQATTATAIPQASSSSSSFSSWSSSPPPTPPPKQEGNKIPKGPPPKSRPDDALRQQQTRLFRALLGEFLRLEDVGDRVVQTGALLERFGGWLADDDDCVDGVLAAIPDGWSADVVAGFAARALRRLLVARREAVIARALSSAQNLRARHGLVVAAAEAGPSVEM